MFKNNFVHGQNIKNKKVKSNYPPILDEIDLKYEDWKRKTERLNSEHPEELAEKVRLLNEYYDYMETVAHYFKAQDKLESSIIEEFLVYLLRDIPDLKENLNGGLLFMGQSRVYLDLSFAPQNLSDFITNPGIYINKKDQDFTIFKKVNCIFENNKNREEIELIVPAVVVECKTYIPKTMFDQAAYEAQRLKEGNPFALYIILAQQNALRDDVNLKNTKVDEIFILRKQKRSKKKKPIDASVVSDFYSFIKDYLRKDWFDNRGATERGRLIRT